MSRPETTTAPATDTAAQNAAATFDPMAAWSTAQQTFHKMFAHAQSRAQTFAEEYAALEAQLFAKAQAGLATWTRLTHDAIAYSALLTQQARKLGSDAARTMRTGI